MIIMNGLLMMTLPLYNPQAQATSLFASELVQPGQYVVRMHANTPITTASSKYGSCKYEGQNAICNIDLQSPTSKEVLAAFKVEPRTDGKYVFDYGQSDSGILPNPAVIRYPSEGSVATTDTQAPATEADKQETKKEVNKKQTGLSTMMLTLLFLMISAGIIGYAFNKARTQA